MQFSAVRLLWEKCRLWQHGAASSPLRPSTLHTASTAISFWLFLFSPPSPRAQCLPQYGGPCSQQHSASSGLRQAADPAAVRALLPTSSPLWPQRRTTPEERHPVAWRVSRQERHWFRFFCLWSRSARGGEGTESERKVCCVGLVLLLCLMCWQACTRARASRHRGRVECLGISTLHILSSVLLQLYRVGAKLSVIWLITWRHNGPPAAPPARSSTR